MSPTATTRDWEQEPKANSTGHCESRGFSLLFPESPSLPPDRPCGPRQAPSYTYTYMHSNTPSLLLTLHSPGHRVNTSQLSKQLRRRQETQYLPHDCQNDVPHTKSTVLQHFCAFAFTKLTERENRNFRRWNVHKWNTVFFYNSQNSMWSKSQIYTKQNRICLSLH